MQYIAPHIPQIVSSTLILIALWSLNRYRYKKKFKERPVTSAWTFLDQNIVEIIHGGVIAPNVFNVLGKLIPGMTAAAETVVP